MDVRYRMVFLIEAFTVRVLSLSSQKFGFFRRKRQTEEHFSLFGQKKVGQNLEKRQTEVRQTDDPHCIITKSTA